MMGHLRNRPCLTIQLGIEDEVDVIVVEGGMIDGACGMNVEGPTALLGVVVRHQTHHHCRCADKRDDGLLRGDDGVGGNIRAALERMTDLEGNGCYDDSIRCLDKGEDRRFPWSHEVAAQT